MPRKIEQPRTEEQIIEDGIKAMTRSIINLIEPCIEQRCRQFMEIVKEKMQNG